jgi:hypothetical protein
MLRGCSDSAPIQPRNNQSQHWIRVCTKHYKSQDGEWDWGRFKWRCRWDILVRYFEPKRHESSKSSVHRRGI